MNRSLFIFIWLLALSAFGANPAFTDFNVVHFRTNGNKVNLNTNAVAVTNFDNTNFISARMALESGTVFSNVNRYIWTNTTGHIQNREPWVNMLVQDGLSSIGLASNIFSTPTNYAPLRGMMYGQKFPYWFPTYFGTATQTVSKALSAVPNPIAYMPDNAGYFIYGGSITNPAFDYGIVMFQTAIGAGHFAVYTNMNGGPFTIVLGLGNVNAEAIPGVKWCEWTNAAPVQGQILVSNIDAGSKPVQILSVGFLNRSLTNGWSIANWASDNSCGWSNMLGTNTAFITGPLFRKINPSLITISSISFDGGIDPGGSSQYFIPFLEMLRTNLPQTDVVFAGSYPSGDPAVSEPYFTTNNNTMVTNALRRGYGFFDAFSPFVDGTTFTNRGFCVAGQDHATGSGVQAYNQLFNYWLDLQPNIARPAAKPFYLQSQAEFLWDVGGPLMSKALNNGNVVWLLPDSSGNARDISTNTAGPGAAFFWSNNVTAINGNPWVENNADAVLKTTNTLGRSFHIDPPFSVWSIIMADALSNAGILDGTNNVSGQRFLLDDGFFGDQAGGTTLTYVIQTGVWYIQEVIQNGAASSCFTNGVQCAAGNAGTVSINGATFGAGQDLSGKFDGKVAFMGCWSGPQVTNAYWRAQMLSSLNDRFHVFKR